MYVTIQAALGHLLISISLIKITNEKIHICVWDMCLCVYKFCFSTIYDLSQNLASQILAPNQAKPLRDCPRMITEVTFRREWTVCFKWPIHSVLGTDAIVVNYFDANICA